MAGAVEFWSDGAQAARAKGTMLEADGRVSRGLRISLANWRMQWV